MAGGGQSDAHSAGELADRRRLGVIEGQKSPELSHRQLEQRVFVGIDRRLQQFRMPPHQVDDGVELVGVLMGHAAQCSVRMPFVRQPEATAVLKRFQSIASGRIIGDDTELVGWLARRGVVWSGVREKTTMRVLSRHPTSASVCWSDEPVSPGAG